MKMQKAIALLGCLLCGLLQVSAQDRQVPLNEPDYKKSRVFVDLPDRQVLHLKELESLLGLSVGTKVNVAIAKDLVLNGIVVSKSNPVDRSVQSVVVKSYLRQGSIFTFTRITEANGSFSYLGRMVNKNAGDALEITREGDGYVIRKKGIYEIINE